MPLTTVSQGLLSTDAQYTGFKNRLINGDMTIDQRANGASTTPSATATFAYSSCDRWGFNISQASKFTLQQNAGSVTPPPGFRTYLGITSTAATTLASGDYYGILQAIEGNNTADLGFGTASASPITLSFWVRSSVTGTFSATVFNYAQTRNYVSSYTITAANTWEYKTLTIPGDTSGTWVGATNAGSLIVYFGFAIGSSLLTTAGSWNTTVFGGVTGQANVLGTNGGTFYITGVQLEKGNVATSFDVLDYATELAMCQRYGLRIEQQQNTGGVSANGTTTNVRFVFPVTMRATPTAGLITGGTWIVGNDYSANYTANPAGIGAQQLTPTGGRVNITGFPSFGSNIFVAGSDVAGTAVMFMSAEL